MLGIIRSKNLPPTLQTKAYCDVGDIEKAIQKSTFWTLGYVPSGRKKIWIATKISEDGIIEIKANTKKKAIMAMRDYHKKQNRNEEE